MAFSETAPGASVAFIVDGAATRDGPVCLTPSRKRELRFANQDVLSVLTYMAALLQLSKFGISLWNVCTFVYLFYSLVVAIGMASFVFVVYMVGYTGLIQMTAYLTLQHIVAATFMVRYPLFYIALPFVGSLVERRVVAGVRHNLRLSFAFLSLIEYFLFKSSVALFGVLGYPGTLLAILLACVHCVVFFVSAFEMVTFGRYFGGGSVGLFLYALKVHYQSYCNSPSGRLLFDLGVLLMSVPLGPLHSFVKKFFRLPLTRTERNIRHDRPLGLFWSGVIGYTVLNLSEDEIAELTDVIRSTYLKYGTEKLALFDQANAMCTSKMVFHYKALLAKMGKPDDSICLDVFSSENVYSYITGRFPDFLEMPEVSGLNRESVSCIFRTLVAQSWAKSSLMDREAMAESVVAMLRAK